MFHHLSLVFTIFQAFCPNTAVLNSSLNQPSSGSQDPDACCLCVLTLLFSPPGISTSPYQPYSHLPQIFDKIQMANFYISAFQAFFQFPAPTLSPSACEPALPCVCLSYQIVQELLTHVAGPALWSMNSRPARTVHDWSLPSQSPTQGRGTTGKTSKYSWQVYVSYTINSLGLQLISQTKTRPKGGGNREGRNNNSLLPTAFLTKIN